MRYRTALPASPPQHFALGSGLVDPVTPRTRMHRDSGHELGPDRCVLASAHSHWLASPSDNVVLGSNARHSFAAAMLAPVSRTSPLSRRSRRTSTARPPLIS